MKLGRALHLQSRRLGTASLKNYKARNQLLHKGSHVCHSWRVEESKVGSAPFKFHLGRRRKLNVVSTAKIEGLEASSRADPNNLNSSAPKMLVVLFFVIPLEGQNERIYIIVVIRLIQERPGLQAHVRIFVCFLKICTNLYVHK
ncbi:uncharacterized protein LOC110041894 [Orbicella faveolata]|uniref:uncharacterized protein LOC110041894 n=1 Tax=Orbicella faveolata TaxID=48498 RepID=UPI0009E1BA45|nr:uncharacterized protein LOC110041894 [Orbicella faveolata]